MTQYRLYCIAFIIKQRQRKLLSLGTDQISEAQKESQTHKILNQKKVVLPAPSARPALAEAVEDAVLMGREMPRPRYSPADCTTHSGSSQG